MTDQFRPEDDDPFRGFEDFEDPNAFGDPKKSNMFGDPNTSFDDPDFSALPDPTSDDLPDELGPTGPQFNRTFAIGLGLLVALLIVGLAVILFVAAQSGKDNSDRQGTVSAIEKTNNAVQTQIAATATAKSWTLTPSNTPLPTATSTYTASPSNTPITPTITPTVVPTTAEPSATPKPGETSPPPTPTASATLFVQAVGGNDAQVGAINTQNAQLQAGQTAFAVQLTLNAIRIDPAQTERAQKTQNAQFGAAQTAISIQLTANAATLTAISSGSSSGVDGLSGASGGSPTPTAPPVATPTFDGTAVGANMNAQNGKRVANVMNLRVANRPVAAQVATRIPTLDPLDITATIEVYITESAQLISAQTALAGQLTANAGIVVGSGTPNPALTQNAQIRQGQTAIAVQLTANAALLNPTALPRGGLYEDLTSGSVAPAGLALLGAAALGLVGLIVAARRMRVRVE